MASARKCNMCGKRIGKYDHSYFNVNYAYTYFSNYDMSTLKLDLCEDCLDKLTKYLIAECKLNPVIEADY